jgi:uncharacterized protein YdbL (DUF1318 family)
VLAALASCVPVTVNITFPQEKLDRAAGSIEDMVGAPEPPTPAPAKPAPAPAKPSSALPSLLGWLAPREALAQGRSVDVAPRIDTRSPELQRAIASRRARRGELREWKNRGCIGETNQALVVPRPGEGCGAEAARLIEAENADRLVIYDTFMEQNNIPRSDTLRVRNAFAKARRERARTNDWIQTDEGQWVRKQ